MELATPDGTSFRPVVSKNPLLWWFKDAVSTGLYDSAKLAVLWVELIALGYNWAEEDGIECTREQELHASRVLSRYVTFCGGW